MLWIIGALIAGFIVGVIVGVIWVNVAIMNDIGGRFGW